MGLLVSVFTDASFDHKTLAAGWAAWIKCNGETTRIVRPFKTPITTSAQAEIGAVANALCFTIAGLRLGIADRIILQTDFLGAISIFDFKKSFNCHSHKFNKICRLAVIAAMAKHGACAIEIRHIKAHVGKISPRHAVNDWADKASRRQMIQVREQLGKRAKPEEN